jgi:hypothetical protein
MARLAARSRAAIMTAVVAIVSKIKTRIVSSISGRLLW